MPPRKRAASQDEASYDGVPTVNVGLDAEPEPSVEEQETPLEVVEVPAVDEDAEPTSTDED